MVLEKWGTTIQILIMSITVIYIREISQNCAPVSSVHNYLLSVLHFILTFSSSFLFNTASLFIFHSDSLYITCPIYSAFFVYLLVLHSSYCIPSNSLSYSYSHPCLCLCGPRGSSPLSLSGMTASGITNGVSRVLHVILSVVLPCHHTILLSFNSFHLCMISLLLLCTTRTYLLYSFHIATMLNTFHAMFSYCRKLFTPCP